MKSVQAVVVLINPCKSQLSLISVIVFFFGKHLHLVSLITRLHTALKSKNADKSGVKTETDDVNLKVTEVKMGK